MIITLLKNDENKSKENYESKSKGTHNTQNI